MLNVSFVLVERYYFVKQHPIGARKNNKPHYSKLKCIQANRNWQWEMKSDMKYENINFETDTGPMLKKFKQSSPCYLQKFQTAIRFLTAKPTHQVS